MREKKSKLNQCKLFHGTVQEGKEEKIRGFYLCRRRPAVTLLIKLLITSTIKKKKLFFSRVQTQLSDFSLLLNGTTERKRITIDMIFSSFLERKREREKQVEIKITGII